MKISVKILFGEERPFEVSSEMSVFELKAMVTEQCNIPLSKQKLLLNGRALVDNKKLGEYNIQEGTKLNVFICQPQVENSAPESLHDVLFEKLKIFWSEEDAVKVADEFMKSMNEDLHNMSLDDIERLATDLMDEEEAAGSVESTSAGVSYENAAQNAAAVEADHKSECSCSRHKDMSTSSDRGNSDK